MHYLEDYLELLEPLREIMREKLTLMRENDLKLQVEFAQLEEDSSEFLNNYRLYQKQSLLSPTKSKINIHQSAATSIDDQSSPLTSDQSTAQQQKQIEYDKIIDRHKQLLKMTTIKMNLANESHDFIERYFRKLEDDLHKFKMELEADYSGLTEILEKRFTNEDCNEYGDKISENSIFDPSLFDIEPLFDSYDDLTMSNSFTDDYTNSYLASQSRRLSTGLIPCNLLNRKQHQRLHSSSRGRKRLQNTNNISKRKQNLIHNSFLPDSPYLNQSDKDELSINDYFHLNNSISLSNLFDDETNILSNFTDQTIDERRYCFCNEMSYGDMIACDNRNCRREWFHYSCVGIITPPKGKWFCADCTQIVQQKLQISTIKRA